MKKHILLISLVATIISANCFKADKDLTINAQKIRLISKEIGWSVGIAKSLIVAGAIKAKQEIYPDGELKVCIEEKDGDLKFIMHSSSIEAEKAKWIFLTASKHGWF